LISVLLAAAMTGAPVNGSPTLITGTARHSSTECPELVTPDALVCRALAAEKSGDTSAAAAAFEEAAKVSGDKEPKTARMWAAAGNLWIAAGNPARAAADLDKSLALPWLEAQQRGEALLDRARAAEAQNDLATARAKLNEAGASISEDPFYWYFSASLAMREGDHIAARNSIDRALKLAPTDPAILFEAGHVADYSGDDDQARIYWEQASAADPNGPIGKDAAKAIEMLGVTPTVRTVPGPGQAR